MSAKAPGTTRQRSPAAPGSGVPGTRVQLTGAFTAEQVDTEHANPARIEDYLRKGRDNYQADRDAAERIKAVVPNAAAMVRANRAYLATVVREIAQAGTRQLLDIGAGLDPVTAQAAQLPGTTTRAVLVDIDPITVVHLQARWEHADPQLRVIAVHGDLLRPARILRDPRLRELLDAQAPVTVVLGAVLHHQGELKAAREAVTRLIRALPSGSHLVITHATGDVDPDTARLWADAYTGAAAPLVPRTRGQITEFFDGLPLTPGGVSRLPPAAGDLAADIWMYGGIGTKP